MNKTLGEDIINDYLNRINNVIEGIGYVISIKILYPSDISLTSLTPLLVLSDISLREKYKLFEDNFVDIVGEFYSLTFLKYPDAVKYNSIDRAFVLKNEKPLKYPELFKDPIINLNLDEDNLKRLQDKDKLGPFWERWVAHIKEYFPIGKSTLWSYAVLRRSGKEIISSAYLILSEDIGMEKAIIINKLCQDLLYEIIMELYAAELKRTEFEKERIERERNFHVGMAHYIKNSMTGLASQEGEIIRFVNKQENSERIRLIAKTQTLIYYLINLVLQLRQKSEVSAIGRAEVLELNDAEYSIPIYNLIQTAYIHTILSKNKLQTFIDEWKTMDLAKAEEGIQVIEVDLNNIKDSFLHNKINDRGLFNKWNGNFIYEAFKTKYDHSYVCIDIPPEIQYSMTLNQCKSIYAAFLEIFDNIYGIKHNMNNASIKLDDSKIKIVAYNTQRKIINWNNDFTDLVNEAKTDGLGLRIIKAAIEDCNCKFSFTDGKAKREKIDGYTIKTYCYQIEKY